MRYLVFRDAATSFSFFFHNHHVISMTTSVSIKVTRKYSHSQEEYMRPLRSLLKSKNVVLKNVWKGAVRKDMATCNSLMTYSSKCGRKKDHCHCGDDLHYGAIT